MTTHRDFIKLRKSLCRASPGWTAEGGCPYAISYQRKPKLTGNTVVCSSLVLAWW
jgi:hypothetical protein